jgi:hypothetical protein
VGNWYEDFHAVSDEEVLALLAAAGTRVPPATEAPRELDRWRAELAAGAAKDYAVSRSRAARRSAERIFSKDHDIGEIPHCSQ